MAGLKKLLWQIYLPFLLIIVFSLMGLSWYASQSLKDFHLDQTAADLRARAELVKPMVTDRLAAHDPAGTDALSKRLGDLIATRITVILGREIV